MNIFSFVCCILVNFNAFDAYKADNSEMSVLAISLMSSENDLHMYVQCVYI